MLHMLYQILAASVAVAIFTLALLGACVVAGMFVRDETTDAYRRDPQDQSNTEDQA